MSEAKKKYYKNFGIKLENKTNDFDADRYIKELEKYNEYFYSILVKDVKQFYNLCRLQLVDKTTAVYLINMHMIEKVNLIEKISGKKIREII